MSKWTQAQMKKIDDVSASALGKLKQQQNAQGSSVADRWKLAKGQDERWERSGAARANSGDADAGAAGGEHDTAAAAPFTVRARAAHLGSGSTPVNKGPPPPPPARLGAAATPPPPPARQPSYGVDSVSPATTGAGPPPPPPRGAGASAASTNPYLHTAAAGPHTGRAAAAGASQAMIPKFSELDETEKEAFFSLLDEYFDRRSQRSSPFQ
ncbi:hypothetical protein CF319_g1889 [Tilletia indica]|nr:hypothetical protein CF319_g1889 [Tilletia indica]